MIPLTDGFQKYDHIWFDLVSQIRLLVMDHTEPMLRKIYESKANVKELQGNGQDTKERLEMLEKVVLNNDSSHPKKKFEVLEDIWARLV